MSNTKQQSLARIEKAITFLMKFRLATAEQLYRAMYGKNVPDGGTAWTRTLKRLRNFEYIKPTRPFGAKNLWYAGKDTEVLSDWSGIKIQDLDRASVNLQSHSLAISSIISKMMTLPDDDPLGVSDIYWKIIRQGLQLDDVCDVLGETQYRSSWSAFLTQCDDTERQSLYSDNEQILDIADNACWEKDAAGLWAWVVACGNQIWTRDDKNYQLAGEWAESTSDGVYLLRDHIPDVIINLRGRGSTRHIGIALEMELTTKTIHDYVRTIAAYQSPLGRTLYQNVVWLYDRTTTGTYLKKALEIVGNQDDQIRLQRISTKDASGTRVWAGADVQLVNDTGQARQLKTFHAPKQSAPAPFAKQAEPALLDGTDFGFLD